MGLTCHGLIPSDSTWRCSVGWSSRDQKHSVYGRVSNSWIRDTTVHSVSTRVQAYVTYSFRVKEHSRGKRLLLTSAEMPRTQMGPSKRVCVATTDMPLYTNSDPESIRNDHNSKRYAHFSLVRIVLWRFTQVRSLAVSKKKDLAVAFCI